MIERRARLPIAAILLLGLFIRLPFLAADFHATNDLDAYRLWARVIHTQGLAAVYEQTDANYPPLLLYAFGFAASLEARWSLDEGALTALLKLPSILADLLTAGLIAWTIRDRAPGWRLFICALYALNPAVWYVSTYWGQTDSVYTLFLVTSVIALGKRRIVPAWAAYALALGTKVQSLALAPLLFSATWVQSGTRGLGRGLAASTGVGAMLWLPWLVDGRFGEAVQSSLTVANVVPRVDVSGYNLWYLMRLGDVHNVSSLLHPAGLPLSYQQIGLGLFGACAAFAAMQVWRQRARSLMLPSALTAMSLFMLLTNVHERYLFPTLAFLLLAASGSPEFDAIIRRRTVLWVYGLLSATFLFNLITIAPFTPLLGTNLVAASVDSTRTLILKGVSLLAAALNTGVSVWLMVKCAALGNLSPTARNYLPDTRIEIET